MKTRDCWHFVLLSVVLLAATSGIAMAQSDDAETADDEKAAAEQTGESEEAPGFVYTTDYLKKRFGDEEGEAAPGVITNESLAEQPDQPAEPPSTAFTNEDLTERFGSAEAAGKEAPQTDVALPRATDEDPGEAEAGDEPGRPSLSPAERAQRITEIDAELKRLEKRLLAIRNPLLAGSVPPTDEERADEEGLDNTERVRRTEAKIDELRSTLDELRSPTDDSPDD
jgi:hypothetical protein